MNSSNYMDGIIPGASITVYLTGTTTKATIYADGSNTPLSNPFFSNLASGTNPGGFIFWAAQNQGLDIQAQGGMGNASCTTSPLCYSTATTLQVDVYPNNSISPFPLPISISIGGTGATTAPAALANLGAASAPAYVSTAPSGACNPNGSTEYLTTTTPYTLYTCNTTWQQGGGGGGGGNLSGSGTTGYIPIWTGMYALGNSLEDYGVANPALFTFHAPIVVLSIPTFSAHVGPLGTMSASWNFDTTTPATALASLGATQSANTVWAGPTSGSPATPGFRALVLADFPSLTLYYQTMQANGSDQTQRPKLNFSTAFALTDSASPAQTTVGLANTTVTPGSYTNTNLTVGADGRITAATNGSGGFTSGQNGNGYWVQDPLGHIHQWGHLSGEVFNCNLITFPTSFTTLGSISAQATDDFAVGSSIQHSIVINASHGCTGISVTAMYDWVSSTGGNGVYWSADGY